MNLGVATGSYRVGLIAGAESPSEAKGFLKAFDPLTGKTIWSVQNSTARIGGVLATAGGLVFQGDGNGALSAYSSDNGERLWKFSSDGSIIAPPMSYEIDGSQYVAVVASANFAYLNDGKLMVFTLGAEKELPVPPERDHTIPEQPPLTASPEELARGDKLYNQFCRSCHGYEARGYLNADLRMMSAATLVTLLSPAAASAHVEGSAAEGFLSGIWHPVSGLDHVLTMVAVGLWGAQLGAPAVCVLPVAIPMVMAFGGTLGLMGLGLPGVELSIAVSAIALGAAVLAEARPPLPQVSRSEGMASRKSFFFSVGIEKAGTTWGLRRQPGCAAGIGRATAIPSASTAI